MNMHVIDWTIVVVVFIVVAVIAFRTQKYVRGVADFLSANRCAGRYILTGAELMAAFSASWFVAYSERSYIQGFPASWWFFFISFFLLVKALSGWVLYRFRETRAMTLAQFFEMRYSHRFRIFTGILAWVAGVANYVIHPAVTARLLVYFCGLPSTVQLFGFEIRTVVVLMFILITVAATLAVWGGQIALMVTDFFQGQLLMLVTIALFLFLFWRFGLSDIFETLRSAPEGMSLLNPFDQGGIKDFNLGFFAIMGVLVFYNTLTFQGNQGYYTSAKSPHEAKMARILSMWRVVLTSTLCLVCAMVAYLVFHNAQYAGDASAVQGTLEQISSNKYVVSQLRTPLVLAHFLPVGLMGLLVAVFLSASVSTDDTYLHAWGSIFIQDVLLPLRKKERLSPKQHLKWLRGSIIGVSILSFFLAAFVPLRDYIMMYTYITAAIFSAGAGAAIIGGLYWKRGTTAGAWSAILTGALTAIGGLVIRVVWVNVPAWTQFSPECPLNGVQMTLISVLSSLGIYVVVSLLNNKKPFNLEQMLHRGKYAIDGEHDSREEKIGLFRKLTGIDKEFTRKDKVISLTATGWVLSWIAVAFAGTAYYFLSGGGISDIVWSRFWTVYLLLNFTVGSIVFVWFLIGGLSDIRKMFEALRTVARDDADDGTVINHHSLADEVNGQPENDKIKN